jgi:acetyl-CoA C-acetyltransferase
MLYSINVIKYKGENMKEIVIVGATRTPIGSFNGLLSELGPVELGKFAANEALKRAGVKPEQVDEIIMGCILTAGHGQNVARQIGLGIGMPVTTVGTTINMLCGSGLRSIQMAYQTIIQGENEIVIAGGTESMSKAAHVLKSLRTGVKMGQSTIEDTMLLDGLTDAFEDIHMGITAENIAIDYKITREEQDKFALESQLKASKAQRSGRFVDEIVKVSYQTKKGEKIIEHDEFIKHDVTLEALQKLRPAFKKDGTVTAGNASGINDGASAVVIMTLEKAKELGLKPIAKIVSFASAGVEPRVMGTGPIPAVKKALNKIHMNIQDIDLIESNEAFAAQSISVAKELGFDMSKVNVNGGAIALGHPIGASGARILTTLIYELKKRNLKTGLATLCIGGGMGTAMIIENIEE